MRSRSGCLIVADRQISVESWAARALHRRSIYGLIVRLVHDHDLAEDMRQDVFVKAFRELDSHRLEDSFSSWILRIANNHVLNHFRVYCYG
jgi:DNA-directed RNA polymerase specialized sigma24 family protein